MAILPDNEKIELWKMFEKYSSSFIQEFKEVINSFQGDVRKHSSAAIKKRRTEQNEWRNQKRQFTENNSITFGK